MRSEVGYPAVSAELQIQRKRLVGICGLSNRFVFCLLLHRVSPEGRFFSVDPTAGGALSRPIAEDTMEVYLDHCVFQEGTQEVTLHCLFGIRAQGCRSSSLHFNTGCGAMIACLHFATLDRSVLRW